MMSRASPPITLQLWPDWSRGSCLWCWPSDTGPTYDSRSHFPEITQALSHQGLTRLCVFL